MISAFGCVNVDQEYPMSPKTNDIDRVFLNQKRNKGFAPLPILGAAEKKP